MGGCERHCDVRQLLISTLGYASDHDLVRGEPSVGVEPKESFLRLWPFSPDKCMVKGSFGIALEKQPNAATVLGVRN